jgi:mannose-1-phosphate guanylyltransferase
MTAEEQLSHMRAVCDGLRHAHAKAEQGRAIAERERDEARQLLVEEQERRAQYAAALLACQAVLEDVIVGVLGDDILVRAQQAYTAAQKARQ